MESLTVIDRSYVVGSYVQYCADPTQYILDKANDLIGHCYNDMYILRALRVLSRGPCMYKQNDPQKRFFVDARVAFVAVRYTPGDIVCPATMVPTAVTNAFELYAAPALRGRPGLVADVERPGSVMVSIPATQLVRPEFVVALRVHQAAHRAMSTSVATACELLTCEHVEPPRLRCKHARAPSPEELDAMKLALVALQDELTWRKNADKNALKMFDELMFSYKACAPQHVDEQRVSLKLDTEYVFELPAWHGCGAADPGDLGGQLKTLAELVAAPVGVWRRPLAVHRGAPALVLVDADTHARENTRERTREHTRENTREHTRENTREHTRENQINVSAVELFLVAVRGMVGTLAAVRCYASRATADYVAAQHAVWNYMERARV